MSTQSAFPAFVPESGPSNAPADPASDSGTGGANRRRPESTRPKNLQACDRCRQKKTKCEPTDSRRDVCQACQASSLSCTFEMPLTVSRTKRVRRGLSVVQVAQGRTSQGLLASPQSEREESPSSSPRPRNRSERPSSIRSSETTKTTSVRREGPTAMSFILHSTPTLPIASLEQYDQTHGYTMYPSPSDSRDGFILVTVDAEPEVHDPATPVLQALRSESWNEVVARLVETFLASTSPRIPIVVREEVSEASPLLLHVMAAVAATRRNCPKEIFAALRSIVRKEMLEQDTTSDPTRQNVQILLVSCLIDDLAVQSGTAAPLSVSRSRLTAAFRMAQDLGMDHDSGTSLSESDQRIWRSAIVIDQWNAIRMGMRPIFDATQLSHVKAGGEDYFEQLVGLSVLGARVMRVVYGPDGLKKAGNDELLSLRDDLLKWKSGLSGPLQFTGVWSTLPAGILHTLHTALYLLLHRPFMRFSFIVPQNLELNVDLEVWVVLATASRLAIEWAANQDDIADLLFFGPYALGLCAWVQYHTWARRREWDGVVTLEKGKAAVTRWTTGMGPGHLPILQAQLEIIPLFHTLTSSTHSTFSTDRGLNPTPGILNRLPETSIAGITFLRDPSHPRGGVLVATRQAAREIKDLPEDTVIIGGPLEEGDQTANASGATNAQEMTMSLPASMSGLVTGDPRFGISTPDWEAAVAALTTYNGFDSLVQGSV